MLLNQSNGPYLNILDKISSPKKKQLQNIGMTIIERLCVNNKDINQDKKHQN